VRLDPVQSPGKALRLGSIVPTPSTSLRAGSAKTTQGGAAGVTLVTRIGWARP
jgi:hypothetical protein